MPSTRVSKAAFDNHTMALEVDKDTVLDVMHQACASYRCAGYKFTTILFKPTAWLSKDAAKMAAVLV